MAITFYGTTIKKLQLVNAIPHFLQRGFFFAKDILTVYKNSFQKEKKMKNFPLLEIC